MTKTEQTRLRTWRLKVLLQADEGTRTVARAGPARRHLCDRLPVALLVDGRTGLSLAKRHEPLDAAFACGLDASLAQC